RHERKRRRERAGREPREAADAVTAGASGAEPGPKSDQQASGDEDRGVGLDRGRWRVEKPCADERRGDKARQKRDAPAPVALARRNEAAEHARRSENAPIGEDEPRRRESDDEAAGEGRNGGEMRPVDGHPQFPACLSPRRSRQFITLTLSTWAIKINPNAICTISSAARPPPLAGQRGRSGAREPIKARA